MDTHAVLARELFRRCCRSCLIVKRPRGLGRVRLIELQIMARGPSYLRAAETSSSTFQARLRSAFSPFALAFHTTLLVSSSELRLVSRRYVTQVRARRPRPVKPVTTSSSAPEPTAEPSRLHARLFHEARSRCQLLRPSFAKETAAEPGPSSVSADAEPLSPEPASSWRLRALPAPRLQRYCRRCLRCITPTGGPAPSASPACSRASSCSRHRPAAPPRPILLLAPALPGF